MLYVLLATELALATAPCQQLLREKGWVFKAGTSSGSPVRGPNDGILCLQFEEYRVTIIALFVQMKCMSVCFHAILRSHLQTINMIIHVRMTRICNIFQYLLRALPKLMLSLSPVLRVASVLAGNPWHAALTDPPNPGVPTPHLT